MNITKLRQTHKENKLVFTSMEGLVGGAECRSRRLRGQTYVKVKYATKIYCVAQGI